MFRAAFSSRSSLSPQFGQTFVPTESDFSTRAPQPEHSWEVYAGLTASTRLPAHAAVHARIVRNWPHPASWRDLVPPDFALALWCREPPLPSGTGAGRRPRLADGSAWA